MALHPVAHKKTSAQSNHPRHVPPLESGDRLSRAEFERRYQAQPNLKKAELVEGVVIVPSPVSVVHGEIHSHIMTLLGVYRAQTPGLRLADNVTLRLDMDNEVQPDALMWLKPELGGSTVVNQDGYLSGTPELIVEIAVSSASYDMHDKLKVYRRNGVQEYCVLLGHERETVWYALDNAQYIPIKPDENGIICSRVFPGLHFHPEKFWADDLAGLLVVLRRGMETAVYQTFHTQLQSNIG